MKLTKFCAFSVAVLAASLAFADADNILVAFSTVGPDKYADGATVLDGERYALVWSATQFGGFNADGTAAVAGDKVLKVAPFARNGRCIPTLFQTARSNVPVGGTLSVYLMDTRVSKTALSSTLQVSGAVEVKDYTVDLGSNMAAQKVGGADKTSAQTSSAALTGDTTAINPVIADIKVLDDSVAISVENLRPGLTYSVKGGLDRANSIKHELVATETETNFIVDKDAATFFSITAE